MPNLFRAPTPRPASLHMSAAVMRSSEEVVSFRMPTPSMPVVSYTTLAGAIAATVTILQPYTGVGIGLALTSVSVGLPVASVLSLGMMGGSGVAHSLGGSESSDPVLKSIAAEAAAAVGVPMPRVFEVNAHEPNAFAASGFQGRDSTIAVTTGLREILSADELKAVLAHEMGHLRHRDVMRNIHIAAATAGLGGIYQLGRGIWDAEMENDQRRRRSNSKDDDKDESSAVPAALALMAGGLVLEGSAHLLRLTASRHAELKADLAAASAFGAKYMVDALCKIDQAAARRPADLRKGKGKAFAFAMISDGTPPDPRNLLLRGVHQIGVPMRTHPTLEQRVSALHEAAMRREVPYRMAVPARRAWWCWW